LRRFVVFVVLEIRQESASYDTVKLCKWVSTATRGHSKRLLTLGDVTGEEGVEHDALTIRDVGYNDVRGSQCEKLVGCARERLALTVNAPADLDFVLRAPRLILCVDR
jgi:hypothetical protein